MSEINYFVEKSDFNHNHSSRLIWALRLDGFSFNLIFFTKRESFQVKGHFCIWERRRVIFWERGENTHSSNIFSWHAFQGKDSSKRGHKNWGNDNNIYCWSIQSVQYSFSIASTIFKAYFWAQFLRIFVFPMMAIGLRLEKLKSAL